MENMNYDVANAFASIENELLDSMIRNMKRHRAEEAEEGFQWEQWQAKQLAGLEEYRRKHAGRLNDRYNSINAKMRMAILQANATGGMAQEKAILKAIQKGARLHKVSDKLQGEFFRINERKMDALLDAVEHVCYAQNQLYYGCMMIKCGELYLMHKCTPTAEQGRMKRRWTWRLRLCVNGSKLCQIQRW